MQILLTMRNQVVIGLCSLAALKPENFKQAGIILHNSVLQHCRSIDISHLCCLYVADSEEQFPIYYTPEKYLNFAVSFGGCSGVVRPADVIEGQKCLPRLWQRRHFDLVENVFVVGMDGVGTLVAGPHEVWIKIVIEV